MNNKIKMMLKCLVKLSMAILQMVIFAPAVIAATSANDSYMNNSTTPNMTNEEMVDKNVFIEKANRRFNKSLIPCTAYIGVLIVVGIIGNSLVFYVFGFRLKRSPQNFLIWLLAVLDLLSCTIGLPTEITDVTLHFKFNSPALCKTMRFVNAFTTMSSICTLVVIAVDRYRRVRKPLQPQITLYQARLSLIPIMIVSLIFSTPAVYVYGLRTIETGFPGVQGLDCTISDQAKLTMVPLIYNGVLFICFIILATSLIVMYSLILRSLKEHAKMFRKLSTCTVSTVMESLSTNETFSTTEESVSSAHSTDCDNPRKQSISTQSCKAPADSVGEVLSVGDLNGCDKEGSNASCWNAVNNSSTSCIKPEDCGLAESYDFHLKDVAERTQMSSFILKNSYVTDTDVARPDTDKDQMKDIETCDPTAPITESHSREDKNNKTDYDTKDQTNIADHSSGHEDAAPRRPSVGHHVSFDVNCSGATSTDLPDLKTWSRTLPHLGCANKRKLSEISLLRDLDHQSQKYVNQILKMQKSQENQEKSKDHNQKQDFPKEKKQESETPKQRQLTRKTTIIAFVVTLVFIISFVPHLCLQVAHLIRKGFDEKLEGAPLALYNTFLRSYFINSVANPIIYGLMNEKFRAEVKLLATWLPCCKRKR